MNNRIHKEYSIPCKLSPFPSQKLIIFVINYITVNRVQKYLSPKAQKLYKCFMLFETNFVHEWIIWEIKYLEKMSLTGHFSKIKLNSIYIKDCNFAVKFEISE